MSKKLDEFDYFRRKNGTNRDSNRAPWHNTVRLSAYQRLKLLLTKSARFGTVFGSFLTFPIEYFRRYSGHYPPGSRRSQSKNGRRK